MLVAGRGRGREWGGQGRFVGGSHSPGTARGTEQDPGPAPQGPVPRSIRTRSTGLGTAFGAVREKPPGLQLGLQEVSGSRAKLIPVTLTHMRASRERERQR